MPGYPHLQTALLVVDQAFGALRLAPDGAILGLDLAAGVPAALEALRSARVRLALAVPQAGDGEPCTRIAVPSVRAPAWIVRGTPHDWSRYLVAELGAARSATVLASADLAVRAAAQTFGLRTAPHALVAAWLAGGRSPAFVRCEAAREVLSHVDELLPYFVEHGEAASIVWGVVPADTLDALSSQVASLQVLRLDASRFDPVLLSLDVVTGAPDDAELQALNIVWSDRRIALLAVTTWDREVVEQLAARRHGALRAATPSSALLQPPSSSWAAARVPLAHGRRAAARPATAGLAGPTAAAVSADLARYTGAAQLDAAGPIVSRHVRHPHARRAVQGLLADLTAAGYQPYTHTFSYQGSVLSSVIADLPGTGVAPLPAPPFAQLRKAARLQAASPALLSALASELGPSWVRAEHLDELPAAELVTAVERRFGLGGWIPWWRGAPSTPGFASELVVVGCHLDGIAGADPATAPAPGADDDASGIACTLAAARALAGLRGLLTHTVRFCFFNAEEQGRLGSAAYASYMKSTGAPVKAVICVDTAGHDVHGSHAFEIHAGASDPAVRDGSLAIARSIARWAAELTALAPAQIYGGTSSAQLPGGDPAIGRADHASFHDEGWPAVVVSEDDFLHEPGEHVPDPSDHTETTVDPSYLADIARAITRTVEQLAQ